MGSKTALCTSTWSNVRELGPQVPQMRPTWAKLGQLSANLGPTWGQLGAPEAKSDCIFTVFFKVCVKIACSLPRAAPEAPRDAQEAPRAGQERPKRHQDGPKSRQERPKSIPRAAQLRLPAGLGGHMGPTSCPRAFRRAPGSHFGPPTGCFSTSRERFCTLFHPPGGILKTVLWAKLMQAYGQPRSMSPCTFYMWISTATD